MSKRPPGKLSPEHFRIYTLGAQQRAAIAERANAEMAAVERFVGAALAEGGYAIGERDSIDPRDGTIVRFAPPPPPEKPKVHPDEQPE